MDRNEQLDSTILNVLVDSKEKIFSEQEKKLNQVIEEQEKLMKLLQDGNNEADKLLEHNFVENIEKFELYTKKIHKIKSEMIRANNRIINLRKRLSKLEDIRLKEQQDIENIKKSQENLIHDIIAKPPE